MRGRGDVVDVSDEAECKARMDGPLDWEQLPILVHEVAEQKLELHLPPHALHRAMARWNMKQVVERGRERVEGCNHCQGVKEVERPLLLIIPEIELLKKGPLSR